jgi:glycosyltransferase involved in cell wall biosynthesis
VKLAILTSSLLPYPVGGAERQAAETARRLAARGHEVTVFARRVPREQPPLEVADGVRWVRSASPALPGLSFAGHVASFLGDWKRHGEGTEVILAYQTVINGVLGALAARQGPPLVSWIRSQSEIRLGASRKYRALTPWVLSRSTRVLLQSPIVETEMLRELTTHRGAASAGRISSRVRILPNAIALGPEPNFSNRSGVVFVGRLIPIKGIEVLLAALRRMETPPALRLLGDGPLRASLEEASRDLPVTFAGRVEPERVSSTIADARLLVAPSWSEGFPNAVLEGLERGIPAIATRVGGIPDVVQDGVNGRLIDPGDQESLAAHLGDLAGGGPLWEQLARGARESARRYAWEDHLSRLEAILEEARETLKADLSRSRRG